MKSFGEQVIERIEKECEHLDLFFTIMAWCEKIEEAIKSRYEK